jgi:O-antigen/teichoic acid export membrane protein
MITTIILRYLGTVLQFVVLSAIAINTNLEVYGLYLLCLSIVFSLYYTIGLGSSESAVFQLPRYIIDDNKVEIGLTIGTVIVISLICAVVVIVTGFISFTLLQQNDSKNVAVAFTLFFLSMNGLMFNSSQLMLAMGHSSLGSFFFYPAINTSLLISTLPAILFLDNISFRILALASGVGSFIAAIIALGVVFWISRRYNLSFTFTKAISLIKEGISLTGSRILHVTSFWVPTMVTGFILTPQVAGVIGTAGRLAISISAVIASLRFVMRPTLVKALVVNNTTLIRNMCGSLASLYIALSVLAIVVNETIGEYIISTFFGDEYLEAVPVLTVFLVGVIAEGMFGPIDELLKMSGYQNRVMILYSIYVPMFIIGTYLICIYDWRLVAWVQVIYVSLLYVSMNIVLFTKKGYIMYPTWPNISILRMIK